MLTKVKPHSVKTREALVDLIKNEELKKPRELNSTVEDELAEICMSLLHLDPEKRIHSAGKLVFLLENYMYTKGYGPTNDKLNHYIKRLFKEE